MAMFTCYFEVSVNFNVENRREKFIILISILYPIYRILIRSQNFLCFLRELLMSFLNVLWNSRPITLIREESLEIYLS